MSTEPHDFARIDRPILELLVDHDERHWTAADISAAIGSPSESVRRLEDAGLACGRDELVAATDASRRYAEIMRARDDDASALAWDRRVLAILLTARSVHHDISERGLICELACQDDRDRLAATAAADRLHRADLVERSGDTLAASDLAVRCSQLMQP